MKTEKILSIYEYEPILKRLEKLEKLEKFEQNNNEWISVQDRLPEINTYVLIVYAGYSMFVAYRDNSEGDLCFRGDDGNPLYNITHWMPLPEPPKE